MRLLQFRHQLHFLPKWLLSHQYFLLALPDIASWLSVLLEQLDLSFLPQRLLPEQCNWAVRVVHRQHGGLHRLPIFNSMPAVRCWVLPELYFVGLQSLRPGRLPDLCGERTFHLSLLQFGLLFKRH
jgi:hypothetical protein